MPELPPESVVVLPAPREEERPRLQKLGFRCVGPQMLRVDLVERLARHAHEARAVKEQPFVDQNLITSLGLQPPAVAKLMRDLGFRATASEAGWAFKGQGRRPGPERPANPRNAFAALAGLRRD